MIKDKIVLTQGDVTEADVDAIVNAAHTDLRLGSGVAGAIRRRGGPQIQADCDKISPIPLGEAAVTRAGGMKAKYVIHAASMRLGGPVTKESLKNTTRNSLLRAEEKGCKSIAFPAIGTGVGGYRINACAKDMLAIVLNHLKTNAHKTTLEEVRFVLYDRDAFDTFAAEYEKLPEE